MLLRLRKRSNTCRPNVLTHWCQYSTSAADARVPSTYVQQTRQVRCCTGAPKRPMPSTSTSRTTAGPTPDAQTPVLTLQRERRNHTDARGTPPPHSHVRESQAPPQNPDGRGHGQRVAMFGNILALFAQFARRIAGTWRTIPSEPTATDQRRLARARSNGQDTTSHRGTRARRLTTTYVGNASPHLELRR